MRKRMTEDEARLIQEMGRANSWDGDTRRAAVADWERARESERSLTGALDAQRGTDPEQAWHSRRCMTRGRASCTEDCKAARRALVGAGVDPK